MSFLIIIILFIWYFDPRIDSTVDYYILWYGRSRRDYIILWRKK